MPFHRCGSYNNVKEIDKLDNYTDPRTEGTRMWDIQVTAVTIIIGVLGSMGPTLRKSE